MSNNSSIEWTDATWNPVVGCSIVSPGCTNCYAMREAHRLGQNPKLHGKYRGLTRVVHGNPVWTGTVRLHEAALLQPLAWKKPRRIFVNSMSDLFHEDLRDEDIDRVFAVMALCPQHTFQVLTKRSHRMREYLELIDNEPVRDTVRRLVAAWPGKAPIPHEITFPLANVWLGVSAEDQGYAEMRIPDLLATPAAVRFVSAEPLLGAIELGLPGARDSVPLMSLSEQDDRGPGEHEHEAARSAALPAHDRGPRLDWVIAGGESGPKARPAHPDWIRSLRDQCVAANVPFFFKQWGMWEPREQWSGLDYRGRFEPMLAIMPDGRQCPDDVVPQDVGAHRMAMVGKSKAAAVLDGRTWREFPS